MSVYSAIGFVIGAVVTSILYSRLSTAENNLNSMRVDIVETKTIVKGIERTMTTLEQSNMEIIKTLIDR